MRDLSILLPVELHQTTRLVTTSFLKSNEVRHPVETRPEVFRISAPINRQLKTAGFGNLLLLRFPALFAVGNRVINQMTKWRKAPSVSGAAAKVMVASSADSAANRPRYRRCLQPRQGIV